MAKALEIELHTIAGRRVEVAIAYDRHQDTITLLDLNDDCILEILSMKCLSVVDLCSVAETCRRLRDIAVRVVRRKCVIDKSIENVADPAGRTKSIIMNFGPFISHLRICDYNFKDQWTGILESVTKYCSSSLESLEIDEWIVTEKFTAKFTQLKKLHLRKRRHIPIPIKNLNQIGDLHQLTDLHITIHRNVDDFDLVRLIERLSKLKDLCIIIYGFSMDLKTYLKIVDVVRGRPDKSKLTFVLERGCQCEEYDYMRDDFRRNEDIVYMLVGCCYG